MVNERTSQRIWLVDQRHGFTSRVSTVPIENATEYIPAHNAHSAATRMRERCVEAIKGLWTTRKGNDYNSALNHAIERVESLTLEGKQEQ